MAERAAAMVRQARDRGGLGCCRVSSRPLGPGSRRPGQEMALTLLLCLLPLLLSIIAGTACLATFVQLSRSLTEVAAALHHSFYDMFQVVSSPAFTNNEYLICQNLIYVEGNSSLPVYQAADQVTDVRSQFLKVLVLNLTASIMICFLLLASLASLPLVAVWRAVYIAWVSCLLDRIQVMSSLLGHGVSYERKQRKWWSRRHLQTLRLCKAALLPPPPP